MEEIRNTVLALQKSTGCLKRDSSSGIQLSLSEKWYFVISRCPKLCSPTSKVNFSGESYRNINKG